LISLSLKFVTDCYSRFVLAPVVIGHVVVQVVEALRYNYITLPAALRPCGGLGLSQK